MNNPLLPLPPLALVGQTKVPNEFPKYETQEYRLAIIGEAPGQDEETYGRPFVGASGNLLNSILSSVGIDRNACFVGNVCPYRPPGNDITEWGYNDSRVVEGADELRQDLANFRPNCCLLLGNTPLYFAAGHVGVSSYRGSILSTSYGKAVPALHPAAVLRDYSSWPLLRFDAQRARREAETPDVVLPQRTLVLDLVADEICNRLDNWPSGRLLSFDIEGGLDAFPCCSVADASNSGFIIAWSRHSITAQCTVAASLSRVLFRADVPKVLQNSLYDRFVLAYRYHMLIRNVVEDTMLKQWEIYPELPKGLGTICSIWTREPYYKSEIKADDQDVFYRYCIKDSCVTLEASLAMDAALSTPAARHYRFNVDLLSPLLYMELKGFAYNSELARSELAQCQNALAECGSRLSLLTPQFPIGSKGKTTNDLRGAKGSISSQRLAKVLYELKSFPPQYKGTGPGKKLTSDVDALLKLQKKFPNDALLSNVLLHRKLEGIRETLEVSTDPDGRVRCGYNLVGTETGRLTCYTSPTGSGANLQTITKKLRKLYRADDGYWLFQCDLAGADGWTVAAHCLRHGDPTMWDDYNFGLKPARIIALMYAGHDVTKMSRAELKIASKTYVDDDSWQYFACKRCQHATNYGVSGRTGADQVMKDSYNISGKPIYIDAATFESLQRLYFSRYPGLYAWHRWAKNEVVSGHNLASASGHTRIFFGRRKGYDSKRKCWDADHDTWKEFLADEPQENTTYATNLALYRLWNDPENRGNLERNITRGAEDSNSVVQKTSLIIQPLHQVHDALIGQFPKDRTEWATGKIRSWFQNPLTIANSQVIIPFDGAYGPNWSMHEPSCPWQKTSKDCNCGAESRRI